MDFVQLSLSVILQGKVLPVAAKGWSLTPDSFHPVKNKYYYSVIWF